MKQNITPPQLQELSRDAQNRLLSWWRPKMGDLFTVTREMIWITYVCRFESDGFIFEDKWYDPNNEMTHLIWCKYHKDACLPLLSIGQMIEFLAEHNMWFPGILIKNAGNDSDIDSEKWYAPFEFCDILWTKVKEIFSQ